MKIGISDETFFSDQIMVRLLNESTENLTKNGLVYQKVSENLTHRNVDFKHLLYSDPRCKFFLTKIIAGNK